jgi:TRAP-type C4-dicarboxylate transport system permease small subunit
MQIIDRFLWRFVDAVLFLAVIGMVVLISVQVASRLAGNSMAWTEELARFLFIWTAWLGMASGFRHGLHPSISILSACVPKAFLAVLRFLPPVCGVVFFCVVFWFSLDLFFQQLRFGEISAILQIGMWVTTLPLVIGSALAIVGAVVQAVVYDPYADLAGEKP